MPRPLIYGPRVRAPVLVLIGLTVVAVGVGVVLRQRLRPEPSPAPAPAPLAAAPAAPPVDAGVAGAPADPPMRPEWDLFGGQPLAWWQRVLAEARAAPDPTRLALLERRAHALGLTITRGPEGEQVAPSSAVLRALEQRQRGQRIGALAPAPAVPALSPAEVRRLHPSPAHPQVILAPRPGERATAYIEFGAGTADDGAKPGLTTLALHAVLTAHARHPYADLLGALYGADAELRFEVATERSWVRLSAPKDRFAGLLGEVTAQLFRPELSAATLPIARRLARRYHPAPDVLEALERTLQRSQLQAPERERLEETYRHTELGAIARHARRVFCPANATIVVAGAFDPARVAALLSRLEGGTRVARPAKDIVEMAGTYSVPADDPMTLLAFPVALDSEAAHAHALLLASLLEDFMEAGARFEGLAYTVTAAPVHSDRSDFVLLSVPLGSEAPGYTGKRLSDVSSSSSPRRGSTTSPSPEISKPSCRSSMTSKPAPRSWPWRWPPRSRAAPPSATPPPPRSSRPPGRSW